MPDTSMPMPDEGDDDKITPGNELPVKLDTLQVDGVRPKVDDHVEVKVGGTITHIVDDCAYVKVETANDEPTEDKSYSSEEEDLVKQSENADMEGAPIGSGYG